MRTDPGHRLIRANASPAQDTSPRALGMAVAAGLLVLCAGLVWQDPEHTGLILLGIGLGAALLAAVVGLVQRVRRDRRPDSGVGRGPMPLRLLTVLSLCLCGNVLIPDLLDGRYTRTLWVLLATSTILLVLHLLSKRRTD